MCLVLLIVLNGVENVMINENGSMIRWEQQENANFPTCITSYTVSWNNNNFSTSNTFVTREELNGAGFPYCQNIPITVTPVTPLESLSNVSATVNATLVSPGKLLVCI